MFVVPQQRLIVLSETTPMACGRHSVARRTECLAMSSVSSHLPHSFASVTSRGRALGHPSTRSLSQVKIFRRFRRGVPFSVSASAVPLVPQDQLSSPQPIPESPPAVKENKRFENFMRKCGLAILAAIGKTLTRTIDGKGLLLLLGWSLQYTLPAAAGFSIYSQVHDSLAAMKFKISRAQAIVLTTAPCLVIWQAISVIWSSAAFATFTLNYPLYQGTACVPEAIATWIGSQQGLIIFLNKLISWSSILFNGLFVWALGSALFSIRPRSKTAEKTKADVASEAANTFSSTTALKQDPFKPAQTAAHQTDIADASLQHTISGEPAKAGPHATDNASSTNAQEWLARAEQQLRADASSRSKLQLQKQLEQVQQQLASKQNSMAAIQEKLEQAEEQSQLHASSKAEALAQAQQAQQQFEKAESALGRNRAWAEKLRARVSEREGELEHKLRMEQKFRYIVDCNLRDVQAELENEREHKAKVHQLLDEAQQQLEQHSKSKLDLQHKLDEAQQLLKLEQDKAAGDRTKRLELQGQLQEAELQLTAWENIHAELQRKLERAELQLSADASSQLQLQKQLEQAEQQLASEQDSMAALQERLEQAEVQSRLDASSKAEALAEAQEVQQRLQAAESKLLTHEERADEQEAEWMGKLEDVESDLENVEAALDDQREHQARMQHTLEQVQQLLKLEQDKVENHRRKEAIQDKHLQDAFEERAVLQEEVDALVEQLYVLEDKLGEMEEQQQLSSGHTALQAELHEVKEELDAQHSNVTKLQQQLQQAEQQSDPVQSSKARLETQLAAMTQQLAAQHSNVTQLQQKLSQTELQLAEDHSSRAELTAAALQAEGNIRQAAERALAAEQERDSLAAKLVRESEERAALKKCLEHELGEKAAFAEEVKQAQLELRTETSRIAESNNNLELYAEQHAASQSSSKAQFETSLGHAEDLIKRQAAEVALLEQQAAAERSSRIKLEQRAASAEQQAAAERSSRIELEQKATSAEQQTAAERSCRIELEQKLAEADAARVGLAEMAAKIDEERTYKRAESAADATKSELQVTGVQQQLERSKKVQGHSTANVQLPTAPASTESFWDLPHPGVAPDWVGPSDKPDQATTQTPQCETVSDKASPTTAAEATSTDMASDETSFDVAPDTLTAPATDATIVADDIVVTVAEETPNSGSVSQADVASNGSSNGVVLVQIEEGPEKSIDWIPVQQVADSISKDSKKPATSKDGSNLEVLVQIEEGPEASTDWIPVQHADTSKVSKRPVQTAIEASPAVNWLIQQNTASTKSTEPGNTDSNVDDDDNDDGSIEVHVHKGLL